MNTKILFKDTADEQFQSPTTGCRQGAHVLKGGDALKGGVETDEGGGSNHGWLGQGLPTGWDEVLQLLEEVPAQTLQHRLSASIPVPLFAGRGMVSDG